MRMLLSHLCRTSFAAVARVALGLIAAGCGTPQHEILPPSNVAGRIVDPTTPHLPPPPPVPADCRAFDQDWLYCIHPRTYGVREIFADPASGGYILSLGPLPPPPPTTPANPGIPANPVAPDIPPATTEKPPPPPQPTVTTARVVILPGYPGDAFDRNINGATGLGASMGTLYSQLFGNRAFSDFDAKPVQPPPGIAQAWTVEAVDATGRCHGFIVRSRNLAAWSFSLIEPGPDSRHLRDRLFSQLRLRLGDDQSFNDLTTDYRIDAPIPPTWTVTGPSTQSRRWDAPDQRGFFILTNGEPRGASVFRTCTADDARQLLADFPPVAAALQKAARDIHGNDRFQPALWAATGIAETTLDTLPHPTTVGVHVFYDPVARKKFCVYYGYQSQARAREVRHLLDHLTRTPLMP